MGEAGEAGGGDVVEELMSHLRGMSGDQTMEEKEAAMAFFYEKVFASLGEIDDKVFEAAGETVASVFKIDEAAQRVAEILKTAGPVGGDDDDDSPNAAATATQSGHPAQLSEEWAQLEAQWDAEYAAIECTTQHLSSDFTQRQAPESQGFEECSPGEEEEKDARAEEEFTELMNGGGKVQQLTEDQRVLLADLRQRIAVPDGSDSEGDDGDLRPDDGGAPTGDAPDISAAINGLNFKFTALPASKEPIQGARAHAMQAELAGLKAMMNMNRSEPVERADGQRNPAGIPAAERAEIASQLAALGVTNKP